MLAGTSLRAAGGHASFSPRHRRVVAGFTLLEDACPGARRSSVTGSRGGRRWPPPPRFSFYPGKNLGAAGDAGALVTRDAGDGPLECVRCASTARRLKYATAYEGLDGTASTRSRRSCCHTSFRLLDGWNEQATRSCAVLTNSGPSKASEISSFPFLCPSAVSPVWHLYAVRTREPDTLAAFLRERGIGDGSALS